MELNTQDGVSPSREVNPAQIVTVADFSPATLRNIAAHLEISSDFAHLIYREAELDAVWSITDSLLMNSPELKDRSAIELLRSALQEAHDLAAGNRPREAAAVLRRFL